MKKLSFLLIAIAVCPSWKAINIDSLIQKLKTHKDDTLKAILYTDISKYCAESGQFEKAISFAEEGMEFCRQQQRTSSAKEKEVYLRCESRAANNAGLINLNRGNPAAAAHYMRHSLEIKKKLGDKKSIAYTYLNIGNIMLELGDYAGLLENSLACMKLSREVSDSMGICYAYNNLGTYYQKTGNNKEAIKNYLMSLDIAARANNFRAVTQLQMNVGRMYLGEGNPEEAQRYFDKALEKCREMGDKFGIANANSAIAEVYFRNGDLKKNLEYEMNAYKIFSELQHQYQAMSAVNLGSIHMKMKNAGQAQTWFKHGLELAHKSNAKETLSAAYAGLASADSAKGQWSSAFENYKLHIQYRDSIRNDENTKKQTQIEMQYEFDRKEASVKAEQAKKDAVAASETRKQQIILYSVASGLVLVLAASGFLYRAYTQKRRANIRIRKQKEIIEEKQSEILDSIYYARRIQKSLLPTEKYIERVLGKHKTQ